MKDNTPKSKKFIYIYLIIGALIIMIAPVFINYTIDRYSIPTSSDNKTYDFSNSNREIIVYDKQGNEIYRESGKLHIIYSEDKVDYIDENGLTHTIYLKDATIIVNELPDNTEG